MRLTFRVYRKGTSPGDVAKTFERKLGRALQAAGQTVATGAKQNAPYITGNLRRSIHVGRPRRHGSLVTVRVGTNAEYAAMVEFGGTIRPKKGKYLRFRGRSGEFVFVRQVRRHPHPYLIPAFDSNKKAVRREIAEALKEACRAA